MKLTAQVAFVSTTFKAFKGVTKMQLRTKDKVIEEYRQAYTAIPQAALELDLKITIKTMQAIAKGNPVSQAHLASLWEMTREQVRAILEQANANGQVEIDAEGNLVGAILTLNQTPHQVSMDDNRLYAWCAWDAMSVSAIVGKPIQIVSEDPLNGETIQLSITPAGIETVRPENAVATVVSPGEDLRAGPESSRCTQMLFFGSRETAERWKQDRTGVSVLPVEEAFELVNEFQIEPARRLGLVEEVAE